MLPSFFLPVVLLIVAVVQFATSSKSSYDTSSDDSYSSSSYSGGQPGYGSPGAPSKYPPAMTHERNRGSQSYSQPASSKRYQEHFEGLFDDFPGPKQKQKIYYPGKGYVYMQVPVQQPDQYGKGGSSSYAAPSSYNDDDNSYKAPSYSSPPSYQPAMPSYNSRPASSYSSSSSYSPSPVGYAHEDDDSPFDYMVKKGAGGGSSYQAPTPAYKAPSYQAPAQPYKPPQQSYSPPAQSYNPPSRQAPAHSYGGGQGDGGYGGGGSAGVYSGGAASYSLSPANPSGYKPSSYPSQYPDNSDGDSSASYPVTEQQNNYGFAHGGGGQGPSAPVSRSYDSGSSSYNTPRDTHSRGFYDLAEGGNSGPQRYSR